MTTLPLSLNFNNIINRKAVVTIGGGGSQKFRKERHAQVFQSLLLEDRILNSHERNIALCRFRNLSKLIIVPILPSVEAQGLPTVFAPSVLVSNVMPIAPKIDEIREVLNNLKLIVVVLSKFGSKNTFPTKRFRQLATI